MVNESGMDDRKTVQYFRDWLVSRQGPNTTMIQTASSSTSEMIDEGTTVTDTPYPASVDAKTSKSAASGILNQKPFFAVIVLQNPHYPHLRHETYSGTVANSSIPAHRRKNSQLSRYFSSLRTMDESLHAMFAALNATDDLRNTIIMGAGDHGVSATRQRLGGE
jgi:arylsulfatase A-like enzyme